ncbi:MAG: metal-dependent transcriptional regulator, partial [Bacteroidia bacterium]
MIKTSDEKYLRAIYLVSTSEKITKATISEVAYYLDLKAPTVLERLKILKQEKLINYNKSSGITLTKTGYKEALNVIRKHRVWETFLVKVCKFG